jgi:hypothetical protein
MTAPTVYTYYDAIEALIDFGHGHGFSAKQEMIRRAVQAAYREIVAARDWTWLYKDGRIQLVAAQTTGSVAYAHTGGTYERQLTLTGATWPDWIKDASVRFDDVVCDVEDSKTPTVITLDVQRNPGADVASGTTYTAYRRWYELPNDFLALWTPLEADSWLRSRYRPVQDLATLERYDDSTGDVYYYAIGSGEGLYGSHVVYVSWPSDTAETFDIPYKRMPRQLRYTGYDSDESLGTITATAGSATVTCLGTRADDSYIGSILRIGTGSTKPTGLEGAAPYGEQRTIIDTTGGSTGTFTLDAAVSTTRSGVAYRITDPVDLPPMAYELLLRCAEKHLANAYRKAVEPGTLRAIYATYQDALFRAKSADAPIRQRRVAGSYLSTGVQLSNVGTINWETE